MAQIPRRYIDNYTKSLNKLSADAQAKLAADLAKIDFTADVATIREAVIARMEFYCGPYANMAAILAANFYDGLREISVGKKLGALAESGREPIATERAVRGIMQDVVDGKPEVAVGKLVSRADYEIKKSAGECVYRNGKRDPLKPKYARVPSGGETCRFCIMLASRGFVYHSEEAAGENSHYHANCDCRIVPGFAGETTIPGYDPDRYYDMWKHPEKYDSAATQDILPAKDRHTRFAEYEAATEKGSKLRRELRNETDASKKAKIRELIDEAEANAKELRSKLTNGEFLIEATRARGIHFVEATKWGRTPSTEEIVKAVGGGDKTKGSCSSLAFAYFSNKAGNVVLDFRGGSSCDFFATLRNIKAVADFDGVKSIEVKDKNAFKAAEGVLNAVQEGKRYYFTAGQHASVVERREDGVYYLELQTVNDNGWHKLTDKELRDRFGCKKSRTVSGMKVDQTALLIDGDSLSESSEFNEMMGFVNTHEGDQKKGVGGHAK